MRRQQLPESSHHIYDKVEKSNCVKPRKQYDDLGGRTASGGECQQAPRMATATARASKRSRKAAGVLTWSQKRTEKLFALRARWSENFFKL